jgi:DNA modification methylase
MAKEKTKSIILNGDVLDKLKNIDNNSINAVITDPPYNVKMADWDAFETNAEYGDWCYEWGKECYRVLKPGGAILSFSGARTYHWLACGLERSGFITRDMLEWIYWASFAKGKNLKPGHEPIYYGIKKPTEDIVFNMDECRVPMDRKQKNAVEDWILDGQPTWPRADIWTKGNDCVGKEYNSVVGKQKEKWKHTTNPPHPGGRVPYNVLTDYSLDLDSPYNIIECKKPRGVESTDHHPTQKPIKLMAWLIKLVTNEKHIVLDPFAGSGTTGEAALLLNRYAVMIEKHSDYIKPLEQRLERLPNKEILFPTKK